MVEWLAGNRIQGTSTERTAGTAEIPAISGAWKELGRTTLGSAGDDIDISGLADKRYYMILGNNIAGGGNSALHFRLGNSSIDTGSNYANRYSANGATDGASTSSSFLFGTTSSSETESFKVGYLSNLSAKEKLWICHDVNRGTAGAGNAPNRHELAGKWKNSSNPIDFIQGKNLDVGNLGTGSEVVVLGYDPDDTHTTNFWEELADVTLSSAGDSLSSGTFTAKKYLWIQGYVKASGAIQGKIRVGNGTIDTGSNYADRNSVDGGSDGTNTSGTAIGVGGGGSTGGEFFNCFVINNASNEKLFIIESVKQNTAGAGTAPRRKEVVGKWSNTSNQINIVEYLQSESGSFDTGSFIKVWGSN
jgi:hypothetical protein